MLAGILIILACGYQYLLGKVSTRVHRPACSGLSRYQYLLGKVSTVEQIYQELELECINIY